MRNVTGPDAVNPSREGGSPVRFAGLVLKNPPRAKNDAMS